VEAHLKPVPRACVIQVPLITPIFGYVGLPASSHHIQRSSHLLLTSIYTNFTPKQKQRNFPINHLN
jgi:hypothetical protein